MNKEWQEQLDNKRQNLIKEFHQMNDNPLDEIYPQHRISEIINSLEEKIKTLKGQIIDIQHDNDRLEHNYLEQLERAKLVDKWIKAYNDHVDTKEETEFIHVFRRILIEHHMDGKTE